MDRDGAGPLRRHQAAEDEREIRDGETGVHVPHRRPNQNLDVDQDGGDGGHGAQRGVVDRIAAAEPSLRGEEGQRDGEAEEDFGEPGVGGRDGGRKKEEDGEAAEHALEDHRAERRQSEAPDPSAAVRPPQPGGEDDGEKAHRRRNQAVAMFVEDAAHPHRRREGEHVPAVGRRPVWHGEPRVGAGDQAARQDEEHRAGGHELGEPMKHQNLAGRIQQPD
jgi:hypothetical protein